MVLHSTLNSNAYSNANIQLKRLVTNTFEITFLRTLTVKNIVGNGTLLNLHFLEYWGVDGRLDVDSPPKIPKQTNGKCISV